MSVADVVASVLAGLVALLGAIFGLRQGKEPVEQNDGATAASHAWRVAAFGLCAGLALVAGILLRTHGWLGESVAAQVALWEAAGFTPEQSRALVAMQRTGVVPRDQQVVDAKVLARTGQSALFSAASSECGQLAQYTNGDELLAAFGRAGGPWGEFAAAARNFDAAQKLALGRAAWNFACKP